MKGIIIFEDSKNFINCKEILDGDYTCVISDYPEGTFRGVINRITGAKCDESDTYDFETGALIALMKMCKFDKSYKAIEEAFKYNSYDNKKNKELEEEIEKLRKENEKLQHKYDLCLNSENALKCSVDFLNKTIAKLNTAIYSYKQDLYKVSKRCMELEVKEDILNKQEETINKREETINKREEEMSVYFGGRGNGKQYKALVELFKKVGEKKVQAAYLTSFNDSFLESCKYAIPYTTEWIKPPTKRGEMWNDILNCKDDTFTVKVIREDARDFLKELEAKMPDVKWLGGGCKPTEWYGFYNWDNEADICYMIVRKRRYLTYEWRHLTNAINAKRFDYLPPMRWDLFKKGRIYIKLDAKHFDEFKQACIRELGTSSNTGYFNGEMIVINIPKEERFVITRDLKGFKARKIINWEDVREFEEESK